MSAPLRLQSIGLPSYTFGPVRLLPFWLAVFAICILGNGIAGRWMSTAEGADFGVESTRTAAAILKYGEFRDPFVPMPTGPTAHVAPVYPLLYSAIVKTFGTGKPTWWAIRLITLAAYALQLALLPLLAIELGFPPLVGVVAAGLGCLAPLPGSCFKWEALFSGLLLVATAYATLCLRRTKTVSSAVSLGVLFGVGLLFSPVVLLVFIAWTFLIWRSLSLKLVLLLAGLSLIIITPWLVRNYNVFGAFIFIRDNLGTELAASNNDCASAWSLDNVESGCFPQVHPNRNLQLDQRIVEIGEYRYNAERLRVAGSWIREHWLRFGMLSLKRFAFFWFPVAAGGHGLALLGTLIISLITALSIPALVLMHRTNPFAARMLTACLFFYPLVYYLAQVELRFRYPILWVSSLAAADLLVRIWKRSAPPRTEDAS
jgi:hypothetical protein